jgi:hypothetical protein
VHFCQSAQCGVESNFISSQTADVALTKVL